MDTAILCPASVIAGLDPAIHAVTQRTERVWSEASYFPNTPVSIICWNISSMEVFIGL